MQKVTIQFKSAFYETNVGSEFTNDPLDFALFLKHKINAGMNVWRYLVENCKKLNHSVSFTTPYFYEIDDDLHVWYNDFHLNNIWQCASDFIDNSIK